jgi:hypothetical protein
MKLTMESWRHFVTETRDEDQLFNEAVNLCLSYRSGNLITEDASHQRFLVELDRLYTLYELQEMTRRDFLKNLMKGGAAVAATAAVPAVAKSIFSADNTSPGAAIAVCWPDYPPSPGPEISRLLVKAGMSRRRARHPYGLGHAGVVLCSQKSKKVVFFDFGRYGTPDGYGTARGPQSVPVRAKFDERGNLVNGDEIAKKTKSLSMLKNYSRYEMEASVVNGINYEDAYRHAKKDVGKRSPYSLTGELVGWSINALPGGDKLEKTLPRNCATWAMAAIKAGGGSVGSVSQILRFLGATPAAMVRALPNDKGPFGPKITV